MTKYWQQFCFYRCKTYKNCGIYEYLCNMYSISIVSYKNMDNIWNSWFYIAQQKKKKGCCSHIQSKYCPFKHFYFLVSVVLNNIIFFFIYSLSFPMYLFVVHLYFQTFKRFFMCCCDLTRNINCFFFLLYHENGTTSFLIDNIINMNTSLFSNFMIYV